MSQVSQPGALSVAAPAHLPSRQSAPYEGLLRRLTTGAASQAIGLTSCAHQEGVSTVSANLAVEAASTSANSVLLVETEFDPSRMESIFGLPAGLGLADALSGTNMLASCIQDTSIPNLHRMGPGLRPLAADADRGPVTFRRLIDALKREFAWVVFDLPIISECRFPRLISSLDGILLVVEAERLRRQVVIRAKDQLEDNHAQVLGVVFNKQQFHEPHWLYRRA